LNAILLRNKGNAHYGLGHHQDALFFYERALNIDPGNSDLWKNKGAALGMLDRYEEALVCFDRGLEIAPRDGELWRNKGTALVALGRHDEAEACFGRTHFKKLRGISRIASIRLFTEPPAHLPDVNYATMGLPKDFIASADRELELDGELVSYVEAHGPLFFPKQIKRLEESKRKAFFSSEAKSPLWDVYFASGGSGVRYSILVEFNVQPRTRLDTAEARKTAFLEYEELFAEEAMKYIFENPKAPTEMIAEHAMSYASHKIMVKYGIALEDMVAIIAEGTGKWSRSV